MFSLKDMYALSWPFQQRDAKNVPAGLLEFSRNQFV
jgi:hypothetical protein